MVVSHYTADTGVSFTMSMNTAALSPWKPGCSRTSCDSCRAVGHDDRDALFVKHCPSATFHCLEDSSCLRILGMLCNDA